jgi:hypothetical protein
LVLPRKRESQALGKVPLGRDKLSETMQNASVQIMGFREEMAVLYVSAQVQQLLTDLVCGPEFRPGEVIPTESR